MATMHSALTIAAWLLATSLSAAAMHVDAMSGPGPAEALTSLPDRSTLSMRGAVYVPAYSSVLLQGGMKIDFAVTLCIHNASADKLLVIERIAYYGVAGNLVQDFLTAPVAVRPFGTAEVHVPTRDTRGGTSANFVVNWAGEGPIAEPVMETLILGSTGTHGYSFVGQGRPIRIVGGNR